jgi:hypothetical protein
VTVSSTVSRLQYGAVVSTTPALFDGLLDDAAMFPPGNASPDQAISEHLRCRTAWFADLVGPLLVDYRRWDEFGRASQDAGSPSLLVTVVGAAQSPARVFPNVGISGFELPVSSPPLPDPGNALRLAAEITGAPDRLKLLTAIAERRAAGQQIIAKYRTGGTSATSFPSEHEVAEVIADASQLQVPLKFTAGLHHAVRFTDAQSGLEQHGFLNLMVAVALAARGRDRTELLGAVMERSAETVAHEVRSWSPDEGRAVRTAFVSFGCCGVRDPVDDLVALGLLDGEGR